MRERKSEKLTALVELTAGATAMPAAPPARDAAAASPVMTWPGSASMQTSSRIGPLVRSATRAVGLLGSHPSVCFLLRPLLPPADGDTAEAACAELIACKSSSRTARLRAPSPHRKRGSAPAAFGSSGSACAESNMRTHPTLPDAAANSSAERPPAAVAAAAPPLPLVFLRPTTPLLEPLARLGGGSASGPTATTTLAAFGFARASRSI